MNETGYIKLYRKITKSDVWFKSPLHLKVWLFILLKAGYQGDDRGVLKTSIKEIQDACSYKVGYRTVKPSYQDIDRVIKWLNEGKHEDEYEGITNDKMIEYTKVKNTIVIKVCNFNDYQASQNNESEYEREYESNTNDNTNHNSSYFIKNEEIKNEEEKNIKVISRDSVLETHIVYVGHHPPTVDEVKEYALSKGLVMDAEKFVDYYTANGWKAGKNPMKDWRAAARNWARNESQYRYKGKPENKSFSQVMAEVEQRRNANNDK